MSEKKPTPQKTISEVVADSAKASGSAPATPAIGSAEFHELSAAERTQIIADDRYKGPHRFSCGHRDCPTIVVAANSPEEARGRYQDLCGILHSESPFTIEAA